MQATANHNLPLILVLGWLLTLLLAAATPAAATGTHLPYLTLKLTVVNDSGGTRTAADFPLFIDGQPVANLTENAVLVGVHKVSLTNQPLYTASSWGSNCKADGTTSSLALGQHKTCTITVKDDPQATLTLVHSVVNDDGGTLSAAAFPLFIDGAPASSGVGVQLKTGTHTVTITAQGGYQTGSWGGACAANGTISLVAGDKKTCTITSNDVAPTLKIVNTVVNDDGGTAAPDDFGLKIDGTAVSSGVANKVPTGTHKVTAAGLTGYSASTWGGDCNPDGSIALALAENKTCTLSYDDKPAEIRGQVFVDKNRNGTREEGEPLLGSWAVYLDNNDNGQRDAGEPSTSTDSDGLYQFTNLRASTYHVRGMVEEGFEPTLPASGGRVLTLSVGETAADKDFGYVVPLPPEEPVVSGVVESVEVTKEVGVGGVAGMSLSVIPGDYRFFTNDLSWFQKYGVQVRFIDESHYEIDWSGNSSIQIQEAFSALGITNLTFVSTAPGCEAYHYQDGSSNYGYCVKVANTTATYSCSVHSLDTTLNLHRFEELASKMSSACAFRQQLLDDYYGRCPASQCFSNQTLFSGLAPPDQISLPLGPNDCRYYNRSNSCSTDACANVQCNDKCEGSTRYYQGACFNGSCSYAQTTCSNGCSAGACLGSSPGSGSGSGSSGQECDMAFDFSRALQDEFACTENIQSEHRLRNVGQKTVAYDLKYRVYDPDNLPVYAKDYPGETLFPGNYSTYNFSAAPFSGQWTKFGSYRLQLTADGFCSSAVSDRTARQVSTAYASVPSTKCGLPPAAEGCSAAIQSSSLIPQADCTQSLASGYSLANKGSQALNYDFLLELLDPDNQVVASRSFRGTLYTGDFQGDTLSKTWFPPLGGWKTGTYSVKATLNGVCGTAKASDQKTLTTAITGACSEPGCPAKAQVRALNAFTEGLAGATVNVDGAAAGQTDATGLLSSSLNDAACGQTHTLSVYCPNGSLCGSQSFRTDFKNDLDKLTFNCTACPVGERALALNVSGPVSAYNGDTVAFEGAVSTTGGTPVDGATLTVANPFMGRSDTLTTVNGKATYSVKASADGFYTFKFTATKTGFKQAVAQKTIAINSFNGKIKANVFNPLGKPIAGAKIYLDFSFKGVTDVTGALTVPAANGTHSVEARCPDNSACASKSINVTGVHSASFACDCGVKAFVVTKLVPENYAIANAMVFVDGSYVGNTMPNGAATLSSLPKGTHSIEALIKIKAGSSDANYKLVKKTQTVSITQSNQTIFFDLSHPDILNAPDFTTQSLEEIHPQVVPLIVVALIVVDAAFTATDAYAFGVDCALPQTRQGLETGTWEWTSKCTETGAFLALDFVPIGVVLGKVGKVAHVAIEVSTPVLKLLPDIGEAGRFVPISTTKLDNITKFVAGSVEFVIEKSWAIRRLLINISELTPNWAQYLKDRLAKFAYWHPDNYEWIKALDEATRKKIMERAGGEEAVRRIYYTDPKVEAVFLEDPTQAIRKATDPSFIGRAKLVEGFQNFIPPTCSGKGWTHIFFKHIIGIPGCQDFPLFKEKFPGIGGKEEEIVPKWIGEALATVPPQHNPLQPGKLLYEYTPPGFKNKILVVVGSIDGTVITAYPL